MNGAPGRRQQRSRHCSYDRGPLGSTCAVKSLKWSNSAHCVFGAFFRVFRRVFYLRNRRLPLKWGKSSVLYFCMQKCAQKMPPIKKKKRTKVDRNFGEQGTVRQFQDLTQACWSTQTIKSNIWNCLQLKTVLQLNSITVKPWTRKGKNSVQLHAFIIRALICVFK